MYHSTISPEGHQSACGCALLPLRTTARGPAPVTQEVDVVDEAIGYYRANVLYKSFDVNGANPCPNIPDSISAHPVCDVAKLMGRC